MPTYYHAYFIKCTDIIYDNDGNITEILCTYDEATRSGSGFNERKPNGTIQFVEASTCKKAEFRLFEPLMLEEFKEETFLDSINPNSLKVVNGYVEEYLGDTKPMDKYQFIRVGYFQTDYDSTKDNLIFNRTVELKSTFK